MAGPKVTFKITSPAKFLSPGESVLWTEENADQFYPAYEAGQIIFIEGAGKIYLDFHNYRKCYTPTTIISGGVGGMNYLGESTTNPLTDGVTISGTSIEPSEQDMVTYKNKEYVYGKNKNGVLGWVEVGDELAPGWEDDV